MLVCNKLISAFSEFVSFSKCPSYFQMHFQSCKGNCLAKFIQKTFSRKLHCIRKCQFQELSSLLWKRGFLFYKYRDDVSLVLRFLATVKSKSQSMPKSCNIKLLNIWSSVIKEKWDVFIRGIVVLLCAKIKRSSRISNCSRLSRNTSRVLWDWTKKKVSD